MKNNFVPVAALVIAVFTLIWLSMSKSKKKGNYKDLYTYYDTLTSRLDAKLGEDSSPMIQTYLDPENCPFHGNLPSLSHLLSMKRDDPEKYIEMVSNGTVKRAVNTKALKVWLLLGSNNADKFQHFMNQVSQLDVDRIDVLNLENALKAQLSKAH
jgi:hypothetical protein